MVILMKLKRCVPAMLLITVVFFFGCQRVETDHASAPPIASRPATNAPALVVRETESPAGADSREPDIFATDDGNVVFSWVEKVADKRYALRFAERTAAGWSEPQMVAEGDNWFVNWADFPSVIKLSDGTLAAHWLVKSGAGTYAYDVNIARSKDGGRSWSKPLIPHTDGTQTEHGFVSLIPLSDGLLGAVWLDGRNLKDVKEVTHDHSPLSASMTLRYAAIDADGKLSNESMLDERVCECCQTSAANTSDGPIVVYRDRSEHEVRDIYIVRWHGGRWSAPQPVHADNWEINGCPVNGPAVAADGRRVAVAWHTEAGGAPRVNVAFSDDAGATFGKPIQVDDGNAHGRVDVLMLPDATALVSWMSGTAEKGAVKVRRVRPEGTTDAVAVVAESDIARSSGFPRMARIGNEVLFSWTQFGKTSRVRMMTTSL